MSDPTTEYEDVIFCYLCNEATIHTVYPGPVGSVAECGECGRCQEFDDTDDDLHPDAGGWF